MNTSVNSQPSSNRFFLIPLALIGAGALWYLTTTMSEQLAGKAPTQMLNTPSTSGGPAGSGAAVNSSIAHEKASSTLPASLEALRLASEESPEDIGKLESYVNALDKAYHASAEPAEATITFAYVDALKRQRTLQPDSPAPLYALAHVSFDNRVFSKAVTYYAEYLEKRPEDLATRSRYASALAFTGKGEEAIVELDKVLSVDANQFSALAYKAITLAQLGKVEEARELGAQAIANAPHDEAKERFESFLETLDKSDAASPATESVTADPAPVSNALTSYLTTNQVTSSKFVSAEQSGSQVTIAFQDFPMQAMPPFAKNKFFGSIKAAARQLEGVETVLFVDVATGETMDELSLIE